VSGWLATMHRSVAADEPLASLVTRNALMYAGEAIWRFKGGEYEMQTATVGTFIDEALTLLSADPEADEIVVDRARFLRFAERRDEYEEVYAAVNPDVERGS